MNNLKKKYNNFKKCVEKEKYTAITETIIFHLFFSQCILKRKEKSAYL